jgi:hypothetical protein
MSKLLQNKRIKPITGTNEHCICVSDNITIIPMYHTNDSLSYNVSRCNYCREEWAEYWISYRYIFSSLISRSPQGLASTSDETSQSQSNNGRSKNIHINKTYKRIKIIESKLKSNGWSSIQFCNCYYKYGNSLYHHYRVPVSLYDDKFY